MIQFQDFNYETEEWGFLHQPVISQVAMRERLIELAALTEIELGQNLRLSDQLAIMIQIQGFYYKTGKFSVFYTN